MSELFIKHLAQRVVQHPDFQTGISNLVVNVMQTVITADFAGERFSLYAAKRPASQRQARDTSIRSEWTGKNCDQLAKRHSLTPRMVRKIAKGK